MTLPEFDRDIRIDPDAEWELEEHLERIENRHLGRLTEEEDERYGDDYGLPDQRRDIGLGGWDVSRA